MGIKFVIWYISITLFSSQIFAKSVQLEDYFARGYYIEPYKKFFNRVANFNSMEGAYFISVTTIGSGYDFKIIVRSESGKETIIKNIGEPISFENKEYKDEFTVQETDERFLITGVSYEQKGWFLYGASHFWLRQVNYEFEIYKKNKQIISYKTLRRPIFIYLPFLVKINEKKGLPLTIEGSFPSYERGVAFTPACSS